MCGTSGYDCFGADGAQTLIEYECVGDDGVQTLDMIALRVGAAAAPGDR